MIKNKYTRPELLGETCFIGSGILMGSDVETQMVFDASGQEIDGYFDGSELDITEWE